MPRELGRPYSPILHDESNAELFDFSVPPRLRKTERRFYIVSATFSNVPALGTSMQRLEFDFPILIAGSRAVNVYSATPDTKRDFVNWKWTLHNQASGHSYVGNNLTTTNLSACTVSAPGHQGAFRFVPSIFLDARQALILRVQNLHLSQASTLYLAFYTHRYIIA